MPLSHERIGSKILAKIQIYILSRAELLITLYYEIPCNIAKFRKTKAKTTECQQFSIFKFLGGHSLKLKLKDRKTNWIIFYQAVEANSSPFFLSSYTMLIAKIILCSLILGRNLLFFVLFKIEFKLPHLPTK